MKKIFLSQGKFAIVDDVDFEKATQFKWYAAKCNHSSDIYYAARATWNKGKRGSMLMHRFLLNVPQQMCVDHINRDGLDNRKENLRICNHAQNVRNQKKRPGKSKYKGVTSRRNRWEARICLNGKRIHLGAFKLEDDAARAYDKAAIKYFSLYARTNSMIMQRVA